MYCPNCGAEITQAVNYCPYCGYSLKSVTAAPVAVNNASYTSSSSAKYGLVLVSRGSCSSEVTGDLLEDIFGYSDSESKKLLSMVPVEVGRQMTEEEAVYVAQMFSEYGIEVSIINENDEYVDLSKNAVRSIFNSDGSLIAAAAAVIGALSAANRVTYYRRHEKPSLLKRLFKTLFSPKPPKHTRRFRPKEQPRYQPKPQPRPQFNKPFGGVMQYRNASDHVIRHDSGRKGGPNGRQAAGGMPSMQRPAGGPNKHGKK